MSSFSFSRIFTAVVIVAVSALFVSKNLKEGRERRQKQRIGYCIDRGIPVDKCAEVTGEEIERASHVSPRTTVESRLSFASKEPLSLSRDGKVTVLVNNDCHVRKFEVPDSCIQADSHFKVRIVSSIVESLEMCPMIAFWSRELDLSKVPCEFNQVIFEENGYSHEFLVIR